MEYELSDRKQIRLQVARESGAVREILIQKVPQNPDKPRLETLLKLNRQQSSQLINLFKALDSIPVEGEKAHESTINYFVTSFPTLPHLVRLTQKILNDSKS
ncbi:hypothetical protein CJ201_13130 [Corynebacterium aurimucosum]|nr:hypothetical protein CJ201_13130 [Corynebacterium aurimucosum]